MELLPQGYGRVLVDGAVRDLADLREAEILALGHVDVIADRAVATPGSRARLLESLEAAMRRGGARADVVAPGERLRFSISLHCPHCDEHFRPASPGLLSFNSPIGACPACRGFGRIIGVDTAKVIPDPSLSLAEGAI